MADVRFQRLAGHPIHAARTAPEQQANVVVRPVALVNADFLAFALRKIHQLGRNRQAGGLLQQRAKLPPQRAAGNIGQAEGVLHDRIIRAADFERAFAGADVQTGLAGDVSFENQFSDQLQFRLRCVRTHLRSRFSFLVFRFSLVAPAIRCRRRWLRTDRGSARSRGHRFCASPAAAVFRANRDCAASAARWCKPGARAA